MGLAFNASAQDKLFYLEDSSLYMNQQNETFKKIIPILHKYKMNEGGYCISGIIEIYISKNNPEIIEYLDFNPESDMIEINFMTDDDKISHSVCDDLNSFFEDLVSFEKFISKINPDDLDF